jgi:cold shock CspA family protein
MIKVTVDWYDVLKGIGEGKTSEGVIVFLNGNHIDSKGHFAALKKGETVSCELKKNDQKGFYASKIVKLVSERQDFNKTTFLEPQKLPLDPEPTI